MEEDNAWTSHSVENLTNTTVVFASFSETNDDTNEYVSGVSLDLMLPDDLLDQIFAYLPIASILRAGSVSKRWYEIASSKRFLCHNSNALPQKPWYYMFKGSDEPVGYAFDPILRKWYSISLPCIEASNWFISSSCGLVCFMDNESRSKIFICNPITKQWKGVPHPPGPRLPDYGSVAISVDRVSQNYNIAVVKSKQIPHDFFHWNISIHLYDSVKMTWTTLLKEVITGWRAGDESVICDGLLYFLIYSAGGGGPNDRIGLLTYNLREPLPKGLMVGKFIRMPCPLTCGRLMNLNEKLILVGGIAKKGRLSIIKGIGIWMLKGQEWEEVVRMPRDYSYRFGEFDDVFASSGSGDLVYIQSYGSPVLLGFDINLKTWKWCNKCPVAKKFPLELFSGFCFEPGLEIAP